MSVIFFYHGLLIACSNHEQYQLMWGSYLESQIHIQEFAVFQYDLPERFKILGAAGHANRMA